MSFIEQLLLLRRLHDLVRRRATGSSQELMEKLNVSKSGLYRQIELLKNLGAPIRYDHAEQNYYYYASEFEWQWEVLRRSKN
ncbi:helix-turn-helix domain-containing protein [Lewinella sp. LCG006]|uniref:helix-turn-helix domain-containing protein n=1 Tax=Lewinella sp. LCG006 TaxID=3231911 RepID=UPI003460C5AD